MKIADTACFAKGFVNPSFVDVKTGERMPFKMRCNTLSYMSAEAMAAAFGGDPSYIPSRIGFIYGPDQGGLPGDITRNQSWERLMDDLEYNNADMQIVTFSYSPSQGDYTNIKPTGSNAITFHAVSNSQDSGERRTGTFSTEDYLYQAVLLGHKDGEYYVLSRVSLYDNDQQTCLRKPKNFEVALDWTVVFR